ncbi:MAG: CHRD domain-containing protein [Planctomycetota bacterium]
MRTRILLAIVGAALWHPATAFAGDMAELQVNLPEGYLYVALHGTVGATTAHPVVFTPAWVGSGWIIDETFFSDTVEIYTASNHIIPPPPPLHGEPPNALGMICTMFQDSADLAPGGNTWPRDNNWLDLPHVNHFDRFTNTLDSTVSVVGGFQRFDNFVYISIGLHSVNKTPRKKARPAERPEPESRANGGAVLHLDPAIGQLQGAIGIVGISHQDLVSVRLHLGPPGLDGPIIADLGPPASWTDLSPLGVAREVMGIPLPPPFDTEFLNGRTYLLVTTVGDPQGALRLQMVEPPDRCPVESYAVTRGVNFGGGLPEVLDGDDQYATVGSGPPLLASNPKAQVVVTGTSPVEIPEYIDYMVQSASTASRLERTRMTLQMFDFAADRWVTLATSVPTSNDGGARAAVESDTARFVQPITRLMLGRVSIFDYGALPPSWQVRFDEIQWHVTRFTEP